MENYVCSKCGWSSGPVKPNSSFWTCPVCGSMTTSNHLGVTAEEKAENKSTDQLMLLFLALAALVCGVVLAFFPGLLVTMLFGTGTLWSWIWGVLISLVVFVCCGADWKKYLVVDAVVIVICALLCWMIDSFEPFSYVFKVIGPFGK